VNEREKRLMRQLEALLFAASEPLDEASLARYIGLEEEDELRPALEKLRKEYAPRGVNLVRVAGKWAFRTAPDLAGLLEHNKSVPRKLSRAALETLAIIAYHQPVTRAEIEEIRGVATSKGTLDVLMETGWIRPRGRRQSLGRPVTWGTSGEFLEHFGLEKIGDLPGLAELRSSGLLSSNLPPGFDVPMPRDDKELAQNELPLEDEFHSGEEHPLGHDEK
jgi:segregation and condensation protein B